MRLALIPIAFLVASCSGNRGRDLEEPIGYTVGPIEAEPPGTPARQVARSEAHPGQAGIPLPAPLRAPDPDEGDYEDGDGDEPDDEGYADEHGYVDDADAGVLPP